VLSEKYDRIEVGRRIKSLRQSQELTVQDLANRSAVSAGYISEVERGLSAVSIDKLAQIAEALGLKLDTLVGEAPVTPENPNVVTIPAALSAAADRLNLSHRATLVLLQGKKSLTARRSQQPDREWGIEDWLEFHKRVKDYLPKD
jgi:transcriptional regulator with XRE-family HTH domain